MTRDQHATCPPTTVEEGRQVADICHLSNSIKKPKTHRYPSLKGVDPKFRRNHRHALHGTMKALVRCTTSLPQLSRKQPGAEDMDMANNPTEGAQGGQAGGRIN
jgi:hypothetical protein